MKKKCIILGKLIVTIPIDPVNGLLPNKPPPLFLNCETSSLNRQHIETASSGDKSELI